MKRKSMLMAAALSAVFFSAISCRKSADANAQAANGGADEISEGLMIAGGRSEDGDGARVAVKVEDAASYGTGENSTDSDDGLNEDIESKFSISFNERGGCLLRIYATVKAEAVESALREHAERIAQCKNRTRVIASDIGEDISFGIPESCEVLNSFGILLAFDGSERCSLEIRASVSASELEYELREYIERIAQCKNKAFYVANKFVEDATHFVIDEPSALLDSFDAVSFRHVSVEFNDIALKGAEDVFLSVTKYPDHIERVFPNVTTLDISEPVAEEKLRSLAFLAELKQIGKFELSSQLEDEAAVSRLLSEYADMLIDGRVRIPGRVRIYSVLGYPLYDGYFGDEPQRVVYDRPYWYDGPDIAGMPAWINDDHVNIRREPSLRSDVIAQKNIGDYVLIKCPVRSADSQYDGIDDIITDFYITSEAQFRKELEKQNAPKWFKVRLLDGTLAYVFGDYLSIERP